jgi:hypothetical protein
MLKPGRQKDVHCETTSVVPVQKPAFVTEPERSVALRPGWQGKREVSGVKPAELEIQVTIPLGHICPEAEYTVSAKIVNHGDLNAKFNLCSVGSHSYRCDLGRPKVYELSGNSTMTVAMRLVPASLLAV